MCPVLMSCPATLYIARRHALCLPCNLWRNGCASCSCWLLGWHPCLFLQGTRLSWPGHHNLTHPAHAAKLNIQSTLAAVEQLRTQGLSVGGSVSVAYQGLGVVSPPSKGTSGVCAAAAAWLAVPCICTLTWHPCTYTEAQRLNLQDKFSI